MQLGELLRALDERAPFDRAADWDPVGLQIGDPQAPVGRAAVCHEVTEAVVRAVEREPVDVLLAYHPLIFEPLRGLVAGADPAGRALRLARAGVALVVAHTSWDVASGGAADALAEALELTDVRGFGPVHGAESLKVTTFLPDEAADGVLDAVVAAGAARIGNYTHCSYRGEGTGTFWAGAGTDPAVGETGRLNREPEVRLEFAAPARLEAAVIEALCAAHPYEEPAHDVVRRRPEAGMLGRLGSLERPLDLAGLGQRTQAALGGPEPRLAGPRDAALARIAVVPGAGSDLAAAARVRGADALVTGDWSHHRARAALDGGLAIVDPGHAATERPGVDALLVWVAAQGLEVTSLLELEADPWWPRA